MKINWAWFLIGIAFAMFGLPLLTGVLGRRNVSTTKSRGA